MAGAFETGKSGAKRSLNAEINLVPFIDLLSMSICFLLMTAVWIQLGSLPVKQSDATSPGAGHHLDLELNLNGPASLTFGTKLDGKQTSLTQLGGTSQAELIAKVSSTVKQVLGQKADGLTVAARIRPASSVPYGTMVAVMDALRKNEVVNLAVVSGAE